MLEGKTAVVTGASSGIGEAAARLLAGQGAVVVPVGRSPQRTARVADEIGAEPIVADFADLGQVRALAGRILDQYPRVDILINNAGAVFADRVLTADGNESTLQVNHLAPYLLTTLLLDRLRANARQAPVRVITTSGSGNVLGRLHLDDLQWERRRWSGTLAYCTTKLANILFTRELARQVAGSGIAAVCVHPGRVASRLAAGTWLSPLMRTPPALTPAQGAQPLVWLSSREDISTVSGCYFSRYCREGRVNRQADDLELAARLWERSAELVRQAPTGRRRSRR